jgi:hypothetical protein
MSFGRTCELAFGYMRCHSNLNLQNGWTCAHFFALFSTVPASFVHLPLLHPACCLSLITHILSQSAFFALYQPSRAMLVVCLGLSFGLGLGLGCSLCLVPCVLSLVSCPLCRVPCLLSLGASPLWLFPCVLAFVSCPLGIVPCVLVIVSLPLWPIPLCLIPYCVWSHLSCPLWPSLLISVGHQRFQ